jgi:hypothetical protein
MMIHLLKILAIVAGLWAVASGQVGVTDCAVSKTRLPLRPYLCLQVSSLGIQSHNSVHIHKSLPFCSFHVWQTSAAPPAPKQNGLVSVRAQSTSTVSMPVSTGPVLLLIASKVGDGNEGLVAPKLT